MPKRWDRSQYPPDWEQKSQAFRAEHNYTCEDCGYVQGDPLISKAGREYPGTVDAAHYWANDTHNPDPQLRCLCKSCHRKWDNQFQEIMAEGDHQVRMHEIALEREGYVWCDHPDCQGYYLPHSHE